MNKINYFSIVGFTALYVLTVFATAFLGFIHPVCWVELPVLAALLGGFSYLCVAARWQRFGAGTLLGLAFGLFLLATGEGGLQDDCPGRDLPGQFQGHGPAQGPAEQQEVSLRHALFHHRLDGILEQIADDDDERPVGDLGTVIGAEALRIEFEFDMLFAAQSGLAHDDAAHGSVLDPLGHERLSRL